MDAPKPTSYDEVPYKSHPFPQTHPDRLATVARIFGMSPPPPQRCRVLELGCASGGNLIPMALTLPGSRLVGVDLSARQVDEGRAITKRLGLRNVELRHANVLDINRDYGLFDYVICHGVYSWVPGDAQDKILDVCSRNLAPNGVAYVSYNTLPGWHMHGMVRDTMLYHAGQFPTPAERVAQGRALLDFLARSVPRENSAYGILLNNALESLRRRRDDYLYHEFLEEFNEPIYFHQFAERAQAKALQYLGEADLPLMMATTFPPEVEGVLRRLSTDLIRLQQHLDFLRNTGFRQSLLCHQHQRLDRTRRPEVVAPFYVAANAQPVSPRPDLAPGVLERFHGPGGTLAAERPLLKAAMLALAENWPEPVPLDALETQIRALLGPRPAAAGASPADDRQQLAASLYSGYLSSKLIEFYTCPPSFTLQAGERPRASPLARVQAVGEPRVTNLRHEVVQLGQFDCWLLGRLDGEHDRAMLLRAVRQYEERGLARAGATGEPGELLEQALHRLARSALLMRAHSVSGATDS
jgi:SAM-dependent methyltransferase/methyltransferase-like protein